MSSDYQKLINSVVSAHAFIRSNERFRRDLLAESGAVELTAEPSREGDPEVKLTFIDGKTLTITVRLREIADMKPGEVAAKLRELFMSRMRDVLPAVKG